MENNLKNHIYILNHFAKRKEILHTQILGLLYVTY